MKSVIASCDFLIGLPGTTVSLCIARHFFEARLVLMHLRRDALPYTDGASPPTRQPQMTGTPNPWSREVQPVDYTQKFEIATERLHPWFGEPGKAENHRGISRKYSLRNCSTRLFGGAGNLFCQLPHDLANASLHLLGIAVIIQRVNDERCKQVPAQIE